MLADIAREIAPVGVTIHVSGCAKGCAHRDKAAITLVGRDGRYDLVRNGRHSDDARRNGTFGPRGAERSSRPADILQPRFTASDEPLRLHPRRRGDLPATRSRSSAPRPTLPRFTPEEEPRRGAHHPRLRHGRGRARTSLLARCGLGGARRRCRPARRSSAMREMVANGVTRARLPADNDVICTLRRPRASPALAARIGNTRTAAAMELWRERLGGAVVAIGNAPTALFRLLEMLDAGRAAAGRRHRHAGRLRRRGRIQGCADRPTARVPYIVVRGRKGGSAMAAAAINAAGERARMTTPRSDSPAAAARRRPRPGRSRAADRQGREGHPRLRRSSPISAKRGRRGNARTIVDPWIGAGQHRAAARLPCDGRDPFPATSPIVDAACRLLRRRRPSAIAAHLAAGRDVALLCEGDPLFYGSFMHLHVRLKDRFPRRASAPA